MSSIGQRRIRPAEFVYVTGEIAGRHTHDEHQLVYASTGLLVVDTPNARWIVPPLRAVWVPAGIPHEVTARIDSTMSTLYVDGSVALDGLADVRGVRVTPLLRELILHATTSNLTDVEHARVEAVLLDQLRVDPSAPLQMPVLEDTRVRAVSDILGQDPSDRRTLGQLGREVGASERTLQRLFKQETGTSFGQWRTQLRLHNAMIELAKGVSVTEAASRSGYVETSSFIQAFRHAFGVTPGSYFRQAR